jgi:hypothetical protein
VPLHLRSGEPNGDVNDAPCPPFATHDASIRQRFDAGWLDAAARGGGRRSTVSCHTAAPAAPARCRRWSPRHRVPTLCRHRVHSWRSRHRGVPASSPPWKRLRGNAECAGGAGESFMRVHWVAVPQELRARRVNRRRRRVCRRSWWCCRRRGERGPRGVTQANLSQHGRRGARESCPRRQERAAPRRRPAR